MAVLYQIITQFKSQIPLEIHYYHNYFIWPMSWQKRLILVQSYQHQNELFWSIPVYTPFSMYILGAQHFRKNL